MAAVTVGSAASSSSLPSSSSTTALEKINTILFHCSGTVTFRDGFGPESLDLYTGVLKVLVLIYLEGRLVHGGRCLFKRMWMEFDYQL
jgi:hypothetical protein